MLLIVEIYYKFANGYETLLVAKIYVFCYNCYIVF